MCGIAGIVARTAKLDIERRIKEMTDAVQHRGPDGEGFHRDGRVAFGHRRLAILDLSPAGHQPMPSADGRLIVTYNGEIYNFVEVRTELEALGHRFRSHSDTEVLLAAYAEWGPECLTRLNGMWSFALLDVERNRIFAARDRFGEKPFHYIETDDCFAFGSEIRQLLPLLGSVKANTAVVSDYLLAGIPLQQGDSFFSGVRNLAAGHYLIYDLNTDRSTTHRYYSLAERLAGVEDRTGPEAVDRFREIFEDSIRLRMRSDVPVGTCLSGGLDSSSVSLVAALQHAAHSPSPFSAITAISEDPAKSEEEYAGQVVRAGRLNWIRTRPVYEDFRDALPRIVRQQEEPFTSPSICMQSFVMQAARENGVTVLLDGQGADETLLGYERYYYAYAIAVWRQHGTLEAVRWQRQVMQNNADMTSLRFAALAMRDLSPSLRYLHLLGRARHLSPRPPLPEWVRRYARACLDLRSLQMLEVETTGLPPLLRFEDKNAMAHSIETRLPFLDHRLVEHCISLGWNLKMRDGWSKWVVRQSMRDVLPATIAWRRTKLGFTAPEQLWLSRHAEVMVQTVDRSSLVRHFCNADRVREGYRRLDLGGQWRLFCMALWEEQFGVTA
ncbi:asparagine synthase (glutamine-hydrolyzing) [Azospirillum sp. sgz301742]